MKAHTWMSTPGWLSLYVEKTCSFLVGMVVFLLMSTVCSSSTSHHISFQSLRIL